jgi:6-phosphogluconate dehydrogenase
MGTNMAERLLRACHQCAAYEIEPQPAEALANEGAGAATSLEDLAKKLHLPRGVWMMAPAAVVDSTLKTLIPFPGKKDVVIDGGNSYLDLETGFTAVGQSFRSNFLSCGTRKSFEWIV